jgi:hypothetical protein
VSIVYVLSACASRLLSSELGNLAGLIAAAAVVFFLAPLQRFAERVASTAMPNTQNTPEYAAFRKLQVYEAAVADALQGDGISQKERALLIRLRDTFVAQLAMPSADAGVRARRKPESLMIAAALYVRIAVGVVLDPVAILLLLAGRRR